MNDTTQYVMFFRNELGMFYKHEDNIYKANSNNIYLLEEKLTMPYTLEFIGCSRAEMARAITYLLIDGFEGIGINQRKIDDMKAKHYIFHVFKTKKHVPSRFKII